MKNPGAKSGVLSKNQSKAELVKSRFVHQKMWTVTGLEPASPVPKSGALPIRPHGLACGKKGNRMS